MGRQHPQLSTSTRGCQQHVPAVAPSRASGIKLHGRVLARSRSARHPSLAPGSLLNADDSTASRQTAAPTVSQRHQPDADEWQQMKCCSGNLNTQSLNGVGSNYSARVLQRCRIAGRCADIKLLVVKTHHSPSSHRHRHHLLLHLLLPNPAATAAAITRMATR